MEMNYEEIHKYYHNGQLGSLTSKLGLTSYDLLSPLFDKIVSLGQDNDIYESQAANYEDQSCEIEQLNCELEVLQDELDEYKNENSCMKDYIAKLEAL
jgi:hypothetical protein